MDTSQIILKFANNIISHPENEKYRSIRIGNKIFQSKLLPVTGGVECLFAMGFEEVSKYQNDEWDDHRYIYCMTVHPTLFKVYVGGSRKLKGMAWTPTPLPLDLTLL